MSFASSLTDKLSSTFKKIRGKGRLSEKNIDEALKEVRMSLLEADVNFRVVRTFINAVKERAVGTEVMKSLSPGQQFVKIVHEEMIRILGGEGNEALNLKSKPPIGIMLVGLQGSGKTTTCGKLALFLKKQKRSPILVPADVYRPGAIKQLKTVAGQVNVPVWDTQEGDDPVDVVEDAMEYAELNGFDTVIVDTAGRLQIDEDMMDEVEDIKHVLEPNDILFVADAMTGQDAVQVAKAFNDKLELSGVVLTKMDGDARGGAALSIRAVTGKPIKFIGMGEKMDKLEVFHPERIASRILGMGDILSLIEQAQDSYDQDKALEMQKKMAKNAFTLEDFLENMRQMRKMGDIQDLLGKIPGFSQQMKQMKVKGDPEKELRKVEAIILSMTPSERKDHKIINASRRRRIAKGSGTSVQEVNKLLKNFVQMKRMMQKIQKGGLGKLKSLFGGGGFPGMGGQF